MYATICRMFLPLTALAAAAALGGCVAYPAPAYYGSGYYGGGYGYSPYAYAYAPAPVVGFNFGWWGGHRWR